MARTSRSSRIGALALGIMLILTGCTDTGTEKRPAPPVSATKTPVPQVTNTVPPADLDEGVKVAEQAMKAFADHHRTYEQWWADLSPLLTDDALLAYADTDPARVRPSQVTGAGVVAGAPNFNQMSVLMPTDIGQYTIDLLRQGVEDEGGTSSWFVDRITPPADLG